MEQKLCSYPTLFCTVGRPLADPSILFSRFLYPIKERGYRGVQFVGIIVQVKRLRMSSNALGMELELNYLDQTAMAVRWWSVGFL